MMTPEPDKKQGKSIDDYFDCTKCQMKNGLHATYCETNLWFDLQKGRNVQRDSK